MKGRHVLFAMLLGLMAPKTTLAETVHLNWNGCNTAGEEANYFACNSNSPLHFLVSSFNAPPGITHFIGATTELLVSGDAPLGDWWAMQGGACRSGALSSEDPSEVGLGDCSTATFDGSVNLGLENYEPNYFGDPNRGRITVDMARIDAGVALVTGTEYQANVIQIRSTKTTGADACAGCAQSLVIWTLRVLVAEPDGAVELDGFSCASWRGRPCLTPNRRQSWGEVKSLYR